MSYNSHNNHSDMTGFTLLEVLISMAIMVFIALAIFQATTETYKLRDILTTEGDFYNGIHLCTHILEQDISLLYSPTIMIPGRTPDPVKSGVPVQAPLNPASNAEEQEIYMTDDLGRTYTYWARAVKKNGIRPSRFIGTEDKLSFISVSHSRIYQESPESEFAKISYELKRDETKNQDPALSGTSVLVKTESSNAFAIDDLRDPFKHSFELLHGIKKLTYTYYQREGNTWKTSRSWDSDKEETKNIYPDYIELKLEVVGPKRQSFDGIFKLRPEIPFNGLNPSF